METTTGSCNIICNALGYPEFEKLWESVDIYADRLAPSPDAVSDVNEVRLHSELTRQHDYLMERIKFVNLTDHISEYSRIVPDPVELGMLSITPGFRESALEADIALGMLRVVEGAGLEFVREDGVSEDIRASAYFAIGFNLACDGSPKRALHYLKRVLNSYSPSRTDTNFYQATAVPSKDMIKRLESAVADLETVRKDKYKEWGENGVEGSLREKMVRFIREEDYEGAAGLRDSLRDEVEDKIREFAGSPEQYYAGMQLLMHFATRIPRVVPFGSGIHIIAGKKRFKINGDDGLSVWCNTEDMKKAEDVLHKDYSMRFQRYGWSVQAID